MAAFDYSSLGTPAAERAPQNSGTSQAGAAPRDDTSFDRLSISNVGAPEEMGNDSHEAVPARPRDPAALFEFLAVQKDFLKPEDTRQVLRAIGGDLELIDSLVTIIDARPEKFQFMSPLASFLIYYSGQVAPHKAVIARLARETDPWIVEHACKAFFDTGSPTRLGREKRSPSSVIADCDRVLNTLKTIQSHLPANSHCNVFRLAQMQAVVESSKEPAHDLNLINNNQGIPHSVTPSELKSYYAQGHQYLYHRYCIKGESYHSEDPIPAEERQILEQFSRAENYPPLAHQESLTKDLLTLASPLRPLVIELIDSFYSNGLDFNCLTVFVENLRAVGQHREFQALARAVTRFQGNDLILAMSLFGDIRREDPAHVTVYQRQFERNELGSVAQQLYALRMQRHQEKFPQKPLRQVRADFLTKEFADSEVVPEEVLDRAIALYQQIAKRGKSLIEKSHVELRNEIRSLVQEGVGNGEDAFKVEFFAYMRELIKRDFGVYPYNTQMLSALMMLDDEYRSSLNAKGLYAQIKTGEGKSLFTTLVVAYRGALGKNIDVLTSNSYLANRDAARFGGFLQSIGVSSGSFSHENAGDMRDAGPRVLYTTSHDLIFSYLVSRLKGTPFFNNQRLKEALVDESDNLAIDLTDSSCRIADPMTPYFSEDSLRQMLTFARTTGRESIENDIGLACSSFRKTNEEARKVSRIILELYLRSAVMADRVKINEDYVINDKKQVVIVDVNNTGRMLDRTYWSHGLHEFVALKHGLPIPPPTGTSAHMGHPRLLQKYDRLYCISGTIGDASDRSELREVYRLYGFDVPPHLQSIRNDFPVTVAKTRDSWLRRIEQCAEQLTRSDAPRPLLIMTSSVAEALAVEAHLRGRGFTPQLLTDKTNHDVNGDPLDEQSVIDRAGRAGMITIATIVAGRGTDIILDEDAEAAGGLHVLIAGMPFHRRVEYQGRGRAGRQGLPGSSSIVACFETDRWIAQLPDFAKRALVHVLINFGAESVELQQTIDFIRRGSNIWGSLNRRVILEREEVAEQALETYVAASRKLVQQLERSNVLFSDHRAQRLAQYVARLFLQERWARIYGEFDVSLAHDPRLVSGSGENRTASRQQLNSPNELRRAFEIAYGRPAVRVGAGEQDPMLRAQHVLMQGFLNRAMLLESSRTQLDRRVLANLVAELERSVHELTHDCLKTFEKATDIEVDQFIRAKHHEQRERSRSA